MGEYNVYMCTDVQYGTGEREASLQPGGHFISLQVPLEALAKARPHETLFSSPGPRR